MRIAGRQHEEDISREAVAGLQQQNNIMVMKSDVHSGKMAAKRQQYLSEGIGMTVSGWQH